MAHPGGPWIVIDNGGAITRIDWNHAEALAEMWRGGHVCQDTVTATIVLAVREHVLSGIAVAAPIPGVRPAPSLAPDPTPANHRAKSRAPSTPKRRGAGDGHR